MEVNKSDWCQGILGECNNGLLLSSLLNADLMGMRLLALLAWAWAKSGSKSDSSLMVRELLNAGQIISKKKPLCQGFLYPTANIGFAFADCTRTLLPSLETDTVVHASASVQLAHASGACQSSTGRCFHVLHIEADVCSTAHPSVLAQVCNT